jgi:predicted nucleic acid-binding protein
VSVSVSDERLDRGVLDTSVVTDFDTLALELLPVRAAISTVTLGELAAGLHTARNATELSIRIMRLQLAESSFEPLPFDASAARCYGHLISLVIAAGQSPRPRRLDLMIAATALANELPLYTRNAGELDAVMTAMTIRAV